MILHLAQAGHLPSPFCLFIDEADMYGHAAYNHPALKELTRYGRHWGVTFIINSRRYAELPKDWTSGADVILAGRSMDPRDEEAVSRIYGREALSEWHTLSNWEFLGISLDNMTRVWYSDTDGQVYVQPLKGVQA
jgi:hypothetical protein